MSGYVLKSPVKSTASIFEPTQTNLPPSFVAFATKVNEVTTGSVTTTGTGFTVGVVEPELVEPEPEEEVDEDEEFDGTEGAGAGAAGGGVGALKVSGADALLAAPVPIPLVASTVNV